MITHARIWSLLCYRNSGKWESQTLSSQWFWSHESASLDIFAAARCSIFLVCFLLFAHWSVSSCSARCLVLFWSGHFSTDSARNRSFPFCECTLNVNVFELSPQSKVTFCRCFSRWLQTTPYWSSTLPTASSVENPTGRWPVAVLASFWSEEHVYRQIHWLCVVLLFV